MDNQLSLKNILLSIVCVIVVGVLLILINTGFSWFFNNVLSSMFNWFNERGLIIKILLLLIGISVILTLALRIFTFISALLANIFLHKMPNNYFTQWGAFLLFIGSTYYSIRELWRLPDGFDFWIVVELLIISFFIIGFNFVVIQPTYKLQNRK